MKSWFDRGCDVSKIQTPKFVSQLVKLISNSDVPYIFVEEPFGRERNSISPLIDCVVVLDTPLDICLARIIKRHLTCASDDVVLTIKNYLGKYEDHMRQIYIATVKQVKNNADFIIHDVASINEVAYQIASWLEANVNKT